MYSEYYLDCGASPLYCRRYGSGTPVLMIHGACVDSDFFHDAAECLSSLVSVTTYDRRGYGRSPDTCEEDHSIAAQAEDAAAIIRHIGEPVHIVAHSGGTVIAMGLIAAYPELVRQVVLYEPASSACLPADHEHRAVLYSIRELIEAQKFTRAINRFMPLIGAQDSRARGQTEDERHHFPQNCATFIRYDFKSIFFISRTMRH